MSTAFSISSGSSSDAVNADTSTLHSINIIIYWRVQNETEIENVLQFDACSNTEEVESVKLRMQTAAQVCSMLSSLCNYACIFHISFILLFRWCRIRRYTVGIIFRSQLCCFCWARWKWHNGQWNAHHNVKVIIPILAFRHLRYIYKLIRQTPFSANSIRFPMRWFLFHSFACTERTWNTTM